MDIQQISENLYRIPIPVPFPMKFIYCYLGKENEGWTIVDAGFHYSEGREAWENVLLSLRIEPRKIRAIYLTHFHPDHFGLAGWLQERSGAPVFMSAEDLQMAERVWAPGSVQAHEVGKMCERHGVPSPLAQQIVAQMEKLNKHVLPLPALSPLHETKVLLGGESWQVIRTPGHSDGHICFYQPEKKWLLAGDHILDRITPNVSLWPGGCANPLQAYLDSLQKVASLGAQLAFPAHGAIIHQLRERIQEIVSHHEERLRKMFAIAKEGRTAYEVAVEEFDAEKLTPHQWRFAMAETLAHLEYLVAEGRLTRSGEETVYYHCGSTMAGATTV